MSVWEQLTTRQMARLLGTLLLFAALLYVLYVARNVIVLVGISLFLAVALGPAVDLLTRGPLPRAAGILVVYVLIIAAVVGVSLLVIPPVVEQVETLATDLPGYLQDLRRSATFRELDERYGLIEQLQRQATTLPQRLGDAAGALQAVTFGAFTTIFELLTVLTITFFLLLDERRIFELGLAMAGSRRSPRLRQIGLRIYRSTAGYVAGALTIAGINATLTFITLTLLGVPFAVPLSVLMFFFGLIPLVGATIGGAVILLVTLFTDFPTATLVYLVVLVVYQQVENNVLQPFVYRRTVNVPPLVVILAILVGSALLGVLGALVAIPVAAAVQILLGEYGPEPLRLTPPAEGEEEPAAPPPEGNEEPAAPPSKEKGPEAPPPAAGTESLPPR